MSLKKKRGRKISSPVLVLNSNYLPINITNLKKAFKLLFKDKAEIVHDCEDVIRTMSKEFKKPSVIRLVYHVDIPYRKVTLTKDNIFKRDNYICAYCPSTKDLTVDHVFPKSRGGKNHWENLITCCAKCNLKKGDRTPEEAGMKLKFKPSKPNPLHFLCESNKFREGWEAYLVF